MAKTKEKNQVEGKGNRTLRITHLIKEIGLNSLRCPHCGKRMDATRTVKDLFSLILEKCKEGVETGKGVSITGFGTFYAKMLKSRIVETPIKGAIETKPRLAIRYRMSETAKKNINKKKVSDKGGKG